jgi:hypothetical protein
MTEAEWRTARDPYLMLEFLRGKASDRKLRLFVVTCCRRVWDGLRDVRSRTAVEVAERFADRKASEDELLAAHDAAYLAVDDCLEYSAFSEDQAVAAYLAAAAHVDEAWERHDQFPGDAALHSLQYAIDGLLEDCEPKQAALIREVIGNPLRPVALDPRWLTSTVVGLAQAIYDDRAFDRLPILADALEDAGCDNADVLAHLRGDGPHFRGCWALYLVLGKE